MMENMPTFGGPSAGYGGPRRNVVSMRPGGRKPYGGSVGYGGGNMERFPNIRPGGPRNPGMMPGRGNMMPGRGRMEQMPTFGGGGNQERFPWIGGGRPQPFVPMRTRQDPNGWASIAQHLAAQGDPRFRQYRNGPSGNDGYQQRAMFDYLRGR